MAYLSHEDSKAKMLLIVSGGGAHSMTDLVFAAGLADSQTFAAGALVSLSTTRKITAGLVAATAMPMFAVNGCGDYDAGQYSYNLLKDVEGGGHGVVNCLPASGGYELQTTEYNDTDGEYSVDDYTPGQCLLTNDASVAGQIEPAPADYSNVTVVGCVSDGIRSTRTGINRARIRMGQKKLLRFWTHVQFPVSTEASA